jgi:hypothetical protein
MGQTRLIVVVMALLLVGSACSNPSTGGDGVVIESIGTSGSVVADSPATESRAGRQKKLWVRLDTKGPESKFKRANGIDADGYAPLDRSENPTTVTTAAALDSTEETNEATPSTSDMTVTTKTSSTTASSIEEQATSTTANSSTRRTTTATSPVTSPPTTARSTTTIPATGQVNTLHVDRDAPAGGDGTVAKPLRRLEDGLKAVRSGQTLIVHGGEYRERINLGSVARGTASRPIRVEAAAGERVVLRGRLRLRGLQHWEISGINVTWDADRNGDNEHMVVLTDGSNWEFRRAEIWGARSYAGVLVAGNPSNWALRHLHIHDTYPTNDTNQDHLIYCNCGNGGGVIERNLLVGSANGRAIKLGTVHSSDADIANIVVRYNTMVDNRGPSNVQLSYRASSIIVEHNIMVSPAPGRENVTTYQLSGHGSVVRNNIGWDSDGLVAAHPGLVDGGGNRLIDPQLNSRHAPQNAEARNYGHLAP